MEHDSQDWAEQLTKTVGQRVAYYRARRTDKRGHKLTAQGLAELCTELGLPTGRPAIAKLESGIRQSITMAEIIVLAKALDVAPAHLIIPVGYARAFEVLPGKEVDPWAAYEWFIGNSEDPADPAAPPQLGADSPFILHAEHQLLVRRLLDNDRQLPAVQAASAGAWEEALKEQLGAWITALSRVRHAMREAGMTPPQLDPEVDRIMKTDLGPVFRRGLDAESSWSPLPPGRPYGPNRGER